MNNLKPGTTVRYTQNYPHVCAINTGILSGQIVGPRKKMGSHGFYRINGWWVKESRIIGLAALLRAILERLIAAYTRIMKFWGDLAKKGHPFAARWAKVSSARIAALPKAVAL